MIIFLEGVNGTGKTAYSKMLAKRLGWPYYRAFRKGADKHAPSVIKQLSEFGITANTHVDDIYMADFLHTFEVDGILERSLPSALAYDQVYKEPWRDQSAKAFKYWQQQLETIPHLYVWLEADYETAKARRSGHCPTKKEHDGLAKVYEKVFQRMGKKKMRINTTAVSIEDGVGAICRRLKNC